MKSFYVALLGSVMVAITLDVACQSRPPRVPISPADAGGPVVIGPDAGIAPTPVDAGIDAAGVDAGEARVTYYGTNLSGGEFGTAVPGVYGTDYKYPSPSDVDYFRAAGMNHIRLLFRHERLQPLLGGALSETEWSRVASLVSYAEARGVAVTLVPYNSYHYLGTVISPAQNADLWSRIAVRLGNDTHVFINPTNEPEGMSTEAVVALDQAGLAAVRAAGFRGYYLAPGNAYTGGGHWTETYYGTSNAAIMDQVGPGDDHVLFEVHQYFDANADGKGSDCVSPAVGVERLTAFTSWLRAHHRRGWLGELAGRNTPTCHDAVTNTLAFLKANTDVYVGWDWWGAGVWSFATTYPFSIGPANPPKPQLAWLRPFLAN